LLQGSCLPAEAKALPRVYAAMSSMRIEDSGGDTLDDVIDRAETRTAARLGLDREGEDPKAALEKIFPAVGLEAQRQLMDCMRSIGFCASRQGKDFFPRGCVPCSDGTESGAVGSCAAGTSMETGLPRE